MKQILESLSYGILAIHSDQTILFMNQKAIRLFKIQNLQPEGKKFIDVLPSPLVPLIEYYLKKGTHQILTEEDGEEFELQEGLIEACMLSFSSLKDKNHQPSGIILTLKDETTSNFSMYHHDFRQFTDDFISLLSHELRSPLTTIQAYLDTLIHRVDPNDFDTQKQLLPILEAEAQRLTSLIENLLDISLIHSGEFYLRLETKSIEEILTSLVEMFRIQDHSHHFQLQLPPSLPKIHLDSERLHQAFFNLMDNAIKFSPEGGEIKINIDLRFREI